MSHYMGIDPGFDRCGYGIVSDAPAYVASGVIQTKSEWTYAERLGVVYNALITIIRSNRVQVVGVERPYAGEKVGKRILEIGGAWGVCLLAAHFCGCDLLELSNSHVKAAVARGGASKEEVRRGVQEILRIELSGPDDKSDALAVAIAARDDWRLAELVREAETR